MANTFNPGGVGGHVLDIDVHFEVTEETVANFARAQEIFREELLLAGEDIGQHVQSRVQDLIDAQGMVNEGHLLNSITWVREMVGSVLQVIVGTNLEYGPYKEFGTVPHFVPFHMAKSLYNQAVNDWGWIPVAKAGQAALNAKPNPRVKKEHGLFTVTGRHQTYASEKHPERLWLLPKADAKPAWGVFVTGMRKPFLFPGWLASVEYIETRLNEATVRAAARINAGGE